MARQEATDLELQAARRTLRRAAILTSGAGIAYGILSIAAWILLAGARVLLSDDVDPREAYSAGRATAGADVASLYLLPIASILFLWFIVALRGWIRGTGHRRNQLISDVQFVSGAVFTAIVLVGAAAAATPTIVAQSGQGSLEVETLRLLAGFGNTVVLVMGVRMAAVFVIATASLGLTTGALPRWFNMASYVFGTLLILTPIVNQVLILAFPIWVIALSILLLYHLGKLRDDELPGFATRYIEEGPSSSRSSTGPAD